MSRISWSSACAALGLSLGLCATGASAADKTLVVVSASDAPDAKPGDQVCATEGGECGLRAAIDEANALREPVTIDIRPGRYEIASPLRVSSAVRLRGTQPNEVSVVASAGFDAPRLISFAGGDASAWRTLSDLTLDANGRAGVIETVGGVSLRLARMVIRGGAIGMREGDFEREPGAGGGLQGNAGGEGGAGVAAAGPLVMEQCSVIDNHIGPGGGRGGAVFVENGPGWITQSTLTGNIGLNSGGIFARNAPMVLDFVSLVGNAGRPVGGYQQNPNSRLRIRGSWLGESTGDRKFDCRTTAEGGGIVSGGDNLVAVTGPTGERLVEGAWRASWEFFCPLTAATDKAGTLSAPLEGAWRRVTSETGLVGVAAGENHPVFRMVSARHCPAADAWGRTLPVGEPCDAGALTAGPAEQGPAGIGYWVAAGIFAAALAIAIFILRRRRRSV